MVYRDGFSQLAWAFLVPGSLFPIATPSDDWLFIVLMAEQDVSGHVCISCLY